MTIYAKTWCPAYPCDPCLLKWGTYPNSDGSESIGTLPGNYLQVLNMPEESDATGYFGVRKWGLPLSTVAGSDPLRFSLPVHGTMIGGAPMGLGPLTVSYGGSVVLTVSGAIVIVTQGPPQGSTGAITWTGYIEVPTDKHVFQGGDFALPWEWTWFDQVSLPQQVTMKWDFIAAADAPYRPYSTWGSSSGWDTVIYYRTGIQEMPSLSLNRQRRRVRLVGRYI